MSKAIAQYGLLDTAAPLLPAVPIVTTRRAIQYLADMLAKPDGISAIEYPGQRLADGIFKLRKLGISIETVTEEHSGPYAGHHARYVLRSKVERLAGSSVHRAAHREQQDAAAGAQAGGL